MSSAFPLLLIVATVSCLMVLVCLGEVSFEAWELDNQIWYPSFILHGASGSCALTMTKLELYQRGTTTWLEQNQYNFEYGQYDRYAWNALGAFDLDLSLRITKSNGEVVTFTDLVTRYDTTTTWYTGHQWCPTPDPTSPPSTTLSPSSPPTTKAPTTKAPTTNAPTTRAPTTNIPTTNAPTTKAPTSAMPSLAPPSDTSSPTLFPSSPPTTKAPSAFPSTSPTEDPSASPTSASNPTASGTSNPSAAPAEPPSSSPTVKPTSLPVADATEVTDDQGQDEDEDTDQTPGEDAASVSFLSFDDPRTIQILAIAVGVLAVCVCVLLLIYCKQRQAPEKSADRIPLDHDLPSESSAIQMIGSPRSQPLSPNASVLSKIAMNKPPSFNTQVVINAMASNTNVAALSSLPPGANTGSNTESLHTWLSEMGLLQYLQVFVQDGFGEDMNDLIGLTDADLKQMGIQAMAHRKRILQEIDNLKDNKGEGMQSNVNLPAVPGPAVPGEGNMNVFTPDGNVEDSSSSEDDVYQNAHTTRS